ncbi:MAG: oligosaccharide flippase family protein [Paludibacter sp.]|nr:oligosaccharide flippase family protein [Paludibacter sp.]
MSIFVKKKLFLLQNIRQKGFFHLLSANLLIQVVAFASQLFVAGILAPDDIGRIKIIQTYLSIFIIFAGMGFSSSTLKLCSENRSIDERNTLFRSALFFTILSTILLYLIILILNYYSVFSSDKLIKLILPLGLFPIISNSLFVVFASYFQAIKKIKLLSSVTISNKLISIISIVILTYLMGIKGYYVAYNISFILILIVCIKASGFIFTSNFFSFKHFYQFKIHWKLAKPSMLAYLLSEMSAYVDIILINYFITDMHQIGYYSFALTITVILKLFPSTVQQITIPYFSSMTNQKAEFLKIFKQYNLILYTVIGLSLITILLFFPFLVKWFLNGKYVESSQYFSFLAIGWSLRQLVQLQNGAIFSLGKIHYNVYTSLITLIFNIIAVSISLFYYGMIGATYASVAGGFVFMICSRYFFRKAYNEMI